MTGLKHWSCKHCSCVGGLEVHSNDLVQCLVCLRVERYAACQQRNVGSHELEMQRSFLRRLNEFAGHFARFISRHPRGFGRL